MNDGKFRYVQTQRRMRAPAVHERITVRDTDGAKLLAKVETLHPTEQNKRIRYDVHVQANSILITNPRSGRRAKRRTYSGQRACR
jgi:hypothetical protein